MKKFVFGTILLLLSVGTYCQQKEVGQPLTSNDYLKKSKNQKTAAWILLGGGFVVGVGAAILDVSSDWTKSETSYLVGIGIGGASMLGSIPLFIASGKNKKRSMNASASFQIRRDPVLNSQGLTLRSVPALSLKLNF